MSNADRPTRPAAFRGGSGEPLVLIHGGTSFWGVWDDCLPLLTPHHDVLAPSLPGHGGVPDGVRPFTVSGFADSLERTMDEAGFATAHLAGNSLGGLLSMELASRGRARSVTAFAPAGGWPAGEKRVPRIFIWEHRQLVLGQHLLPVVMSNPISRRMTLRRMVEHADRMSRQQALSAAVEALHCSLFEDFGNLTEADRTPYGDLGVPVLIAWGDHDRMIPAGRYGEPWRHLVDNITWRTLPDVGHVPMYDDPVLVARTILDWISRATASG